VNIPKPDEQMESLDAHYVTHQVSSMFDVVAKCAAVCACESEGDCLRLLEEYLDRSDKWSRSQVNNGIRKGEVLTHREMRKFLVEALKHLLEILGEKP
jgi:hypothetical protein